MVAVGAFCTARTKAGGQLIMIFCHPDGSDWFALWSEVAENGADDSLRFDPCGLRRMSTWQRKQAPTPFCIKLESEIDGVNETFVSKRVGSRRRRKICPPGTTGCCPCGAVWSKWMMDATGAVCLVAIAWRIRIAVKRRPILFYEGQRCGHQRIVRKGMWSFRSELACQRQRGGCLLTLRSAYR